MPKSCGLVITGPTGEEIPMYAPEKVFASGSKGYFAGGKLDFEGKRFQLTCSIVEIGSKPKPAEQAAE